MSRAFTLAGVAIAAVALAGTADQARANALSATMTIAGKKVVALAEPAGRAVGEKVLEIIVMEGLKDTFGVKENGEPIHSAGPHLNLKGIEALKAVQSLKGIESPDLN
jgi:hypothetical protein